MPLAVRRAIAGRIGRGRRIFEFAGVRQSSARVGKHAPNHPAVKMSAEFALASPLNYTADAPSSIDNAHYCPPQGERFMAKKKSAKKTAPKGAAPKKATNKSSAKKAAKKKAAGKKPPVKKALMKKALVKKSPGKKAPTKASTKKAKQMPAVGKSAAAKKKPVAKKKELAKKAAVSKKKAVAKSARQEECPDRKESPRQEEVCPQAEAGHLNFARAGDHRSPGRDPRAGGRIRGPAGFGIGCWRIGIARADGDRGDHRVAVGSRRRRGGG